jgi:uncharacterized membrane-anchored protein
MTWCKSRALAYLPNDPENAVASMLSDLGKHPETALLDKACGMGAFLGMAGIMAAKKGDVGEVRRWINGFN